MSFAVLSGIAAIIVVGATLAMQAPANAVLARALGDPVLAAALSFGVGFVLLSAIALARGSTPSLAAFDGLPWWALCGGALGALWVLAAILALPRLGVVTMFSSMILGQLIAALAIDAIGAFGMQPREISANRLLAVAMIAGGVVLSQG